MIALGLIGEFQLVTRGYDHRYGDISDVKREIHHADDLKLRILLVTPCLLTRIREFIHI